MKRWKILVLRLNAIVLAISFVIFLVTGYTALYWAWIRSNSELALPYLPWARNFGMLAIISAAVAFGILFSSNSFPLSPKPRLLLSILAAAAIGFFAEFRNEGKFHLKKAVHFFGPGTWIHDVLNRVVHSLGDFLYRIEYSHWNDFLMGPAIVSVLFVVVFFKIYWAFRDHGSISLSSSAGNASEGLDGTLRFARILMNVGLFCFFIQAWAEKAGYLNNSHSNDEIDLPFEFAGTMLGFWMARVLTKPLDARSEKFRSTFFIDFFSSGIIGLLYTFIIGPLTEGVSSIVAHGLTSTVPESLEAHEYTLLQQHTRPFELLLLAGAMWWGLNRFSNADEVTLLRDTGDERVTDSRWNGQMTTAKALGVTIVYLVSVVAILSILEPEGLGWTLAAAAAGVGTGTAAVLLIKRVARRGFTTIFAKIEGKPSD